MYEVLFDSIDVQKVNGKRQTVESVTRNGPLSLVPLRLSSR